MVVESSPWELRGRGGHRDGQKWCWLESPSGEMGDLETCVLISSAAGLQFLLTCESTACVTETTYGENTLSVASLVLPTTQLVSIALSLQ